MNLDNPIRTVVSAVGAVATGFAGAGEGLAENPVVPGTQHIPLPRTQAVNPDDFPDYDRYTGGPVPPWYTPPRQGDPQTEYPAECLVALTASASTSDNSTSSTAESVVNTSLLTQNVALLSYSDFEQVSIPPEINILTDDLSQVELPEEFNQGIRNLNAYTRALIDAGIPLPEQFRGGIVITLEPLPSRSAYSDDPTGLLSSYDDPGVVVLDLPTLLRLSPVDPNSATPEKMDSWISAMNSTTEEFYHIIQRQNFPRLWARLDEIEAGAGRRYREYMNQIELIAIRRTLSSNSTSPFHIPPTEVIIPRGQVVQDLTVYWNRDHFENGLYTLTRTSNQSAYAFGFFTGIALDSSSLMDMYGITTPDFMQMELEHLVLNEEIVPDDLAFNQLMPAVLIETFGDYAFDFERMISYGVAQSALYYPEIRLQLTDRTELIRLGFDNIDVAERGVLQRNPEEIAYIMDIMPGQAFQNTTSNTYDVYEVYPLGSLSSEIIHLEPGETLAGGSEGARYVITNPNGSGDLQLVNTTILDTNENRTIIPYDAFDQHAYTSLDGSVSLAETIAILNSTGFDMESIGFFAIPYNSESSRLLQGYPEIGRYADDYGNEYIFLFSSNWEYVTPLLEQDAIQLGFIVEKGEESESVPAIALLESPLIDTPIDALTFEGIQDLALQYQTRTQAQELMIQGTDTDGKYILVRAVMQDGSIRIFDDLNQQIQQEDFIGMTVTDIFVSAASSGENATLIAEFQQALRISPITDILSVGYATRKTDQGNMSIISFNVATSQGNSARITASFNALTGSYYYTLFIQDNVGSITTCYPSYLHGTYEMLQQRAIDLIGSSMPVKN